MRNEQIAVRVWLAAWVLVLFLCAAYQVVSEEPKRLDPAAWGSDHVGMPVPEYTTGDECLFCHRETGKTWVANHHNLTIRPFDPDSTAGDDLRKSPAKDFAGEVKFVMGSEQRLRFLKPSKEYGKLELLSREQPRPHWNATQFADSCAGCHATAVDPKEKAFAAVSLDCFVCHGSVPPEHAKKPELAYLSPKRKEEARVVASICAQCHVRTGKSKETGRPYPTNFVAGDNLFRDFQADFSDEALKALSVADRHVMENVRDVVLLGREAVTCLSCHDVHGRSGRKHHFVPKGESCLTCHNADGPKQDHKPLTNSSRTCGY